MIQEMWGSFPRLIERNINALLDGAFPRPVKAYHLYKACKTDDLWNESFEAFSRCLEEFFARPRSQRRKSQFDRYLRKPMSPATFSDFKLDFRTGTVSEKQLGDVASWAHHLIRVSRKTASAVISIEIMTKTLRSITNPGPLDKAEDIEFEDFCSAWKRTVFKIFGKKLDAEFNAILSELHLINVELKEAEEKKTAGMYFPTCYLTQTEIDWTLAVKTAALEYARTPKFPLSRGPQKQALVDLARVASLYNIVQTTSDPELIKHRENIRATILHRCDGLVRVQDAA